MTQERWEQGDQCLYMRQRHEVVNAVQAGKEPHTETVLVIRRIGSRLFCPPMKIVRADEVQRIE